MSMRSAAVAAGLIFGLAGSVAHASYIIDVKQVGANVIATGSGSINLDGLTSAGGGTGTTDVEAQGGFISVGNAERLTFYSGITGPDSFGPSSNFINQSANSGRQFDVSAVQNEIAVPRGYVSGDNLGTSTGTWNNTTLADLFLTPGTSFKYTWSSDTFTVNVLSVVPLPASAPMFGAALMALGAVGYAAKRKKAAAAA